MEYLIEREINPEELHRALELSFPDTFEGVIVTSDRTVAVFTEGFSTADRNLFDDIVATHDATIRTYRIYDHVADTFDETVFPGFINYKTGLIARLHPVHTIVRGELKKTVYHANSDGVNYDTPVLEVSFTWYRDSSGFCLRRDSKIAYYLNDGSIAEETKDLIKYYNEQESIEEGRRRRQNIVNDLSLTLIGMLQMTVTGKTDEEILQLGRDWLKANKTDIETFVEASDKTIHNVILNDLTWWLYNIVPNTGGLTIRTIMYDKAQVS
jgi:hypothetical protein